MITGDHPATAHAVAEGLDLPHQFEGTDLIASGDELSTADPNRRRSSSRRRTCVARTQPEQKHLLVEGLRTRGRRD
jgi:magnesium-transporting ATPase (P-type)